MPWTFTACLIAALAISGMPPLNGFVSKWLIYQGIIDRGGALFPLFLLTAMFGSALTLASFMKLLYSLFWGDRPKDLDQVKEAGWAMRIPVALLAIACLFFGIFYLVPVNQIIRPILGEMGIQAVIPGIWQSTLATVLLIISLIIGFLFYLGGRARQAVETEVFLGGEALDPAVYRVPGTQFYGPIKGLGGLKQLLSRGERGDFDLSTRGVNVITWAANAIFKFVDQALSDLFRELVPALIRILGQILQTLNRKQVLTYVLWIAYAGSAVAILRFPEQASAILTARIIACVGIFGWAILALIENDLRRFLTFAATSQLGFVLLGGTASWRPALIHFVSAGLAILALFFCCRSIYRKRNTYNMQEMDGLAEQMPGRFIVFLLAALWLSGLPPFGSFFSKYLLGISFSGENLIFPMILAAAALLTLGYSLRPLRHFLRVGE